MLRTKGRWIDDKAEDQDEDTELEEEDSDIDDISVTTDVAAAEDEDFIVEVVKRRFGIAEQLNLGTGVAPNQLIQAQPTALAGLRSECGKRYNSDCSAPRIQSGDPVSGVQLGDVKSSVVIGSGYSGPVISPSGSRRKKLPKASQQSVVPSSISERARSAQLKAKVLPISPQALQANAVSSGVQASAMDVEKTEAV